MSKAIATRMKNVLNDIIAKDQTGFIAGRNISENLRKILDVLEYTEAESIPGILV